MLQTLKVAFFRHFYRFSSRRAWSKHLPPGDSRDQTLSTSLGNLPVRLFPGSDAAKLPLVVYFHGGGWVIGDLDTHSAYCRALANASGASVVAVDYRLAPEHTFPQAQEDSLAALAAIIGNAEFGPSNGSIVLAGDSAGGHLSLCTALAANDDLRSTIGALIAIYPVVDHYSTGRDSYAECATGQALTTAVMQWFWDSYLGSKSPDDPSVQSAFPIRSDSLASLPPTLLCTCGRDPLKDEGQAMATALVEAGVTVHSEHYPDSEHGFACTMGPTPDFDHWLKQCADWIRQPR